MQTPSFDPSFQVLKFAISEIWILFIRLCFGKPNCHFNATYWSCRQPASHKSCKVPENMIYELSYGKRGPLIPLTLQNVATCQSPLSWLNWRCVCMFSSLTAPTSTPMNTNFYPSPLIHRVCSFFNFIVWVWILHSDPYSACASFRISYWGIALRGN